MRTWADVNLDAVRGNAARFSAILNGAQLIAVVKANAYGHGAVRVAGALQGTASRFAVVSPDEALELRTGGVAEPILVLGPLQRETVDEALDANAEVCLSTLDDARMLAAATIHRRRRLPVHLKVETGMNRCGTRPDELGSLLEYLSTLPLIRPVGVWTHFAVADDPGDPFTREQFHRFTSTLARYGLNRLLRHASNSGGVLNFPDMSLDAARVGIGLYGVYPSAATLRDVALTPALTWKARICRVADAPPGETVSYGRRFTLERTSRLATLAVGYADGYPRLASNRGWVLIRGRRAPIRGTICMDSLVCDVTDIPDAAYGDTATLVGTDGDDRIHVDDLAGWAETISYEILTGIGRRVKRFYRGGEANE
jgi:alanine racemase